MRRIYSVFFAAVVVNVFLAADVFAIKGTDLDINGYIGFDVGQFVSAQYQGLPGDAFNAFNKDFPFAHIWLGSTVGNINLSAQSTENLKVLLGVEVRNWFNSFPTITLRNKHFVFTSYNDFYLHQAQGIYTILNNENLKLEVASGVMPYKYNSEVRNLGEYLFRSGTYPAYIINNFDFPMARLAGLRTSVNYNTGNIRTGLDLLIRTEREMRPFHDLSISAIAKVNVLKAMELGGGIDLAHLWAVDDAMTTPPQDDNVYANAGDTGNYTFKGTKIMGRATIDPLFFMRTEDGPLGDGGKFYGEIAVLGLKSYPSSGSSVNPYGYDGLKNKVPIMFGVNFPTMKMLDFASLEFEYWQCDYADSYEQVIYNGLPLPANVFTYQGADTSAYYNDSWKWSVYLKKSISRNFGVILQFARDHSRYETQGAFIENRDFGVALVKPENWSWRSKIEYKF